MLRLRGCRVESLWDAVLPERLRGLLDDVAEIDALVRDGALLSPGRGALGDGRRGRGAPRR
jgi:hypothetical protein